MPPNRTKRLTPDEKERIVELRLNRVSVTATAEAVGCTRTTVQKTWNRYLKDRATERRADLEAAFEDTIARLDKNATDARRGYLRAVQGGEDGDAARYLAAERQALVELAKLGVVRDDEPAQAARVQAAQATALLGVITRAAAAAQLSEAQRGTLTRIVAEELRALT